jgi:acyl-CoA thioesterase
MTRQMRTWQPPAPFTPGEKAEAIARHRQESTYFGLLGLQMLDLEPGYCRLQLPFKMDITHGEGTVQGGILTTLADSCIAHASVAALRGVGKITTTIELKINFIRPAFKGVNYTAEAWLIHLGRRTAVGEAEIVNDEGKLVAKCLSSMMVLEARSSKS